STTNRGATASPARWASPGPALSTAATRQSVAVAFDHRLLIEASPSADAGWPNLGVSAEACQDREMRRAVLSIVALLLALASASFAADPRASARADLIASILAYRSALDRLWEYHVVAVKRATAEVEKRRDLLARGIVSRRELEDSERELETAEGKLTATRRE